MVDAFIVCPVICFIPSEATINMHALMRPLTRMRWSETGAGALHSRRSALISTHNGLSPVCCQADTGGPFRYRAQVGERGRRG